eukprot:TRINITY_DN5862_c0_g3_i4.p1 TRINITY_DN5862_c0_g3~~TRINITY_DN5862_c0_g3_i4.p1  ORF type:complete len:569 (+),score=22.43 TRINITY_DN5862_c0_g3_i4:66-1772(+)
MGIFKNSQTTGKRGGKKQMNLFLTLLVERNSRGATTWRLRENACGPSACTHTKAHTHTPRCDPRLYKPSGPVKDLARSSTIEKHSYYGKPLDHHLFASFGDDADEKTDAGTKLASAIIKSANSFLTRKKKTKEIHFETTEVAWSSFLAAYLPSDLVGYTYLHQHELFNSKADIVGLFSDVFRICEIYELKLSSSPPFLQLAGYMRDWFIFSRADLKADEENFFLPPLIGLTITLDSKKRISVTAFGAIQVDPKLPGLTNISQLGDTVRVDVDQDPTELQKFCSRYDNLKTKVLALQPNNLPYCPLEGYTTIDTLGNAHIVQKVGGVEKKVVKSYSYDCRGKVPKNDRRQHNMDLLMELGLKVHKKTSCYLPDGKLTKSNLVVYSWYNGTHVPASVEQLDTLWKHLEYIHDLGYFFVDVRFLNILFGEKGGDDVLIIDFDMVRYGAHVRGLLRVRVCGRVGVRVCMCTCAFAWVRLRGCVRVRARGCGVYVRVCVCPCRVRVGARSCTCASDHLCVMPSGDSAHCVMVDVVSGHSTHCDSRSRARGARDAMGRCSSSVRRHGASHRPQG